MEAIRVKHQSAVCAAFCFKQTSAPYLVLNESSQRQVIKQVCEELPHIGVAIFAQALIIKAISAQLVQM